MIVSANVVSTVRRPHARRVSSRPLLEPGAAPGYGPIFNAGLLHHGGSIDKTGITDTYFLSRLDLKLACSIFR